MKNSGNALVPRKEFYYIVYRTALPNGLMNGWKECLCLCFILIFYGTHKTIWREHYEPRIFFHLCNLFRASVFYLFTVVSSILMVVLQNTENFSIKDLFGKYDQIR